MPDTNFAKNRLVRRASFQAIMDKYNIFGSTMSIKKFFELYVCTIDPDITYSTWCRFMSKFHQTKMQKTDEIMTRAIDLSLGEEQYEDSALKKILAIGDLSLDQVIEQPDLLNAIPLKDRMKWFFGAMKARDSRTTVKIKQKEQQKKESLWDSMLIAAQYGAIDGEVIDEKPNVPRRTIPAPISSSPEKGEVVFDPSSL